MLAIEAERVELPVAKVLLIDLENCPAKYSSYKTILQE